MPEELVFKRFVLKLSGEAMGHDTGGLDTDAFHHVAAQVQSVTELGAEVAVVIGGGNFFRGLPATQKGLARTTGDAIGMLATVMNGLALRDCLENVGVNVYLRSAFDISGLVSQFDNREAKRLLGPGTVLVMAGGTGHPFFTTDTTAALRACELDADAVLKGTKVDGVYSADPHKNANAVRYQHLTFPEALRKRLGIMDSTAFSLCMDNSIPIVVFNFFQEGSLKRVALGDTAIATIVDNEHSAESSSR